MTVEACPELEELFTQLSEGHGPALEHAKHCVVCSAILEEHRQLEKDLYRLADPLPPADLVHKVMAKVAAEPRPIAAEVRVGISILLAAGLLAVMSLLGTGIGAGTFGKELASFFVDARVVVEAVGQALASAWAAAGVPLAAGSFVFIVVSLLGLRRLTAGSGTSEAQV